MARYQDRDKAIALRKLGKSYSEIKNLLGVSKSTLSVWLREMPLTAEQIYALRAINPQRIERFRTTMRSKQEAHLKEAYDQAKRDVGAFSDRDKFISGLYLYWGEGTKAAYGRVAIANSDPDMVAAFMKWLLFMHVPKSRIRARLQLYKDMRVQEETLYWSRHLGLPVSQFRKPYIKDSRRGARSYKGMYGHGTCDLSFDNVVLWRYISMALKYLREAQMRP